VILYFSGSCGALPGGRFVAEPENVLADRATIMLSYHLIRIKKQDQHKRWDLITKARKKRKK